MKQHDQPSADRANPAESPLQGWNPGGEFPRLSGHEATYGSSAAPACCQAAHSGLGWTVKGCKT